MSAEDVAEWVRSEIPRWLSQDTNPARTEVHELPSMKDNFSSDMFEIVVHSDASAPPLQLMLKLMFRDTSYRKLKGNEAQFSNEAYFYSKIIPFISGRLPESCVKNEFLELFCKCYKVHFDESSTFDTDDCFKDAFLLMKDVRKDGFELGPRDTLDLAHCTRALNRLGLFHAVSYFVKERDPEGFKQLVKPIIETNYRPKVADLYNNTFHFCQKRLLNALSSRLPDDDPGVSRLRALASRPAFDVFRELVIPDEPLSILCHGDFLRNNLLFRYGPAREPLDLKMIDFQTVRYASPAIDVTLLLCMNTNRALRRRHWNEILKAYHESLEGALAELFGSEWNEKLRSRYSYQAVVEELRQRAVYGFLIAVDFLPKMLCSDEERQQVVKFLFGKGAISEEYNELLLRIGGEPISKVLTDLAEDLLEHHFL